MLSRRSRRVFEKQEPSSDIFDKEDTEAKLRSRLESLVKGVRQQLEEAGFEEKYMVVEEYLNLRSVSHTLLLFESDQLTIAL